MSLSKMKLNETEYAPKDIACAREREGEREEGGSGERETRRERGRKQQGTFFK